MTDPVQIEDLLITNDEATETLRAIRRGHVDAVVVLGSGGNEVFTFRDPNQAYRALVEAMGEGATLVTTDGVIAYHNPRFAELTSSPRTAALRGQSLRDLVPSEAAKSIDALLERAQQGPAHLEVALELPGGAIRPLQLTASPTVVGDLPLICVIATDLGEQRLQEELYRKALIGMEGRERLISIAGHELRAPLQNLSLQVDLLLERHSGAQPPDLATTLSQLHALERKTTVLTNLVNTLLDLGRVDSDQLELDVEDIDLPELVQAVAERSTELATSGSPITFRSDAVRGQWDRVRLEQVVANLLSNAAKYGLGKPIEVVISGDERVARLSIQDNGIGIASDARERLFRPFERIAKVKTRTGLGLGLYITDQIVKAHGGAIHVESTPGVGSRFVLELPTTRS